MAIYIIFPNLGENRGGLTRAVYDRISILSESHTVRILNFNLGSDQSSLYERIAQKEGWPRNVEHYMVFHRNMAEPVSFAYFVKKLFCLLLLAPILRKVKFGPQGLRLISWNKSQPNHIIFVDGRAIWIGKQRSKLAGFLAAFRLIETTEGGPEHLYAEMLRPHEISRGDTLFIEESEFIAAANNLECQKFFYLHEDHLDEDGRVKSDIAEAIARANGVTILVATREQRDSLSNILGDGYDIETLSHYTRKGSRKNTSKKRAIVSVSRIDFKAKPIKDLVFSIASISDVFRARSLVFEFFGSGVDIRNLERLIMRLGISDFVSLNGYTSNPEKVYARSLASIFPSYGEGFGLSALESLSCGCPVISSDVRYGPREMIKEELRIDISDPQALRSALTKILERPDDYRLEALETAELYSVKKYKDRLGVLLSR